MRKIKDVLRLTHDGHLNMRQVALSLNISRSTVKSYQDRAHKAGLSWPLPHDLTEEALEEKLFPPLISVQAPAKALADFDYIYREFKADKKFNLTLDQLWREYKEQYPTVINTRSSVGCIAVIETSSTTARTTRAVRSCLSITVKDSH